MADPRAATNRKGIRPGVETFQIDASTIVYDSTKSRGSVGVDLAVTLSAAGVVALAADADPILGVLLLVESDGFCSVQTSGYVNAPGGVSAVLTAGLKVVGALGASSAKGYVRGIVVGTLSDVAKGRGMITDGSVSTNVEIML